MELTRRTEGDCTLYTATERGEALGYIAIHSTIAGRSCGGLRLMPDVSEAEICGLARAMTLKYGLLGLPQGGAKGGVRGDPDASQAARRARLVRFAEQTAPLLRERAFVACADMGTDALDIRHMLSAIGVSVGRRELRLNSSGLYTAMSVQAGVVEAARHIGLDLPRATAVIEGFGKVGGPLARLLARRGVTIIGISTSRGALYNPGGLDIAALEQASQEAGSRMVDIFTDADRFERSAILELPVDILCPCARHDSITAMNATRVRAKIICAGANNPVTPEARAALAARGTLCLPDFLTNSGGVLGGTMEFASIRQARILPAIQECLGPAIASVLRESVRLNRDAFDVAQDIAMRRFAEVKRAAEHPTCASRVFAAGLALYRGGFVPGLVTAPFAVRYFQRLLKGTLPPRGPTPF